MVRIALVLVDQVLEEELAHLDIIARRVSSAHVAREHAHVRVILLDVLAEVSAESVPAFHAW
jgi:hypothetical protein